MRSYSTTRCRDCGHEEVRYANVRRCRACGGPVDRPQLPADAELRLLRELRADVERWRESSDLRDLSYALDTLNKLNTQFPTVEGL